MSAALARQLERVEALAAARSTAAADRLAAYRADPARLFADGIGEPDPWQAEFLRSTDRLNLILCARQVGKSSVVATLALHTALTVPHSTVVIVCPIEAQANEMLRKVASGYNAAGRPVAARREAVTTLELVNGSRVIALPGKERSVHSYTATLLIIDEAARVGDEVYHAASPQLSASQGRLVALSTAFSKSGWFFKEWTEGTGFRRWSITARECPRHTPEFLDRERRSMGDRWFAMSYLNEFGDDVAAVFSTEDIAASLNNDIKPLFGRS
ncbi:terminase large subunit domain-containing protein [Gemmata sp.]|uniref:terminase large subunit domain-containing protein n=1 Tax=Gemmata sp. TaxID=1914242 RepID=UPI003F6FB55C